MVLTQPQERERVFDDSFFLALGDRAEVIGLVMFGCGHARAIIASRLSQFSTHRFVR